MTWDDPYIFPSFPDKFQLPPGAAAGPMGFTNLHSWKIWFFECIGSGWPHGQLATPIFLRVNHSLAPPYTRLFFHFFHSQKKIHDLYSCMPQIFAAYSCMPQIFVACSVCHSRLSMPQISVAYTLSMTRIFFWEWKKWQNNLFNADIESTLR